jgi:non-ribosomal peptide synthetase component F
LQGEELERHLAYWRTQLGGTLPVLQLTTDRDRPANPTYNGAQLNFRLSPEMSAGLKELSRHEGVTLFMTLLASFQTLLHRHTGQEEILVGTAIANRNYRETEDLIGFFINQLVLRTDLSGELTFGELLQRVKEVCLGAYAHQDLPFEKLVEELQPERDLSRSPIIQVHIGYQKAVRQTATIANTHFSPLGSESTQARFDLTLWVTDLGQQLVLTWTFSTDLFNPETITNLHHSYETLLRDLLAHPTKSIKELNFVSEKQAAREIELFEENRERFRAVKPKAQTLKVKAATE